MALVHRRPFAEHDLELVADGGRDVFARVGKNIIATPIQQRVVDQMRPLQMESP